MYGGLVIIFMLTLLQSIWNIIALLNPQLELGSWSFWLYWSPQCLMGFVIPIFFLLDGFRRTKICLKEGETISKSFVLLVIGAYGFGLINEICLLTQWNYSILSLFGIIIFSFFLTLCDCMTAFLLATILYKLGTQQSVSRNTVEIFEKLDERET